MAHNIETMAYANAKPWHGLGTEVADTLTPAQMQKAAQLDWTVSKRPAYTITDPEYHEKTGVMHCQGHHFIVRDTDSRILSQCGDIISQYKTMRYLTSSLSLLKQDI